MIQEQFTHQQSQFTREQILKLMREADETRQLDSRATKQRYAVGEIDDEQEERLRLMSLDRCEGAKEALQKLYDALDLGGDKNYDGQGGEPW